LGHELIHWTGHETRLHRINKLARFGDESYAVEELVADLGQAMLLGEIGVPQSEDLSNVTAYLGHWLKVLERDHSAIFVASSAASKAVDMVLSFSRPKEEEQKEPELVGDAA
jgi:antirestriction protein ArdC